MSPAQTYTTPPTVGPGWCLAFGGMIHADDELTEEDELRIDPPVVHRVVPAVGQPLPNTRGFSSVFDFGETLRFATSAVNLFGAKVKARNQDVCIQDAVHLRVTRQPGLVTVSRVHYLDTAEWQEREAARRARQRPPKPTAKAKTKSRKLVDLVGV